VTGLEREVHHIPPCNGEVKNDGSCTFTPTLSSWRREGHIFLCQLGHFSSGTCSVSGDTAQSMTCEC
jgi:hypothetical protein